MSVEHPHAFRRLSELNSVLAECHLCGFKVKLDRGDLDRLTAVRRFGQIWRMAFCPSCRAAGEGRLNMVLHTDWNVPPYEPRVLVVGRQPAPVSPAPSAPGPFEHLPRRALFRPKRVKLKRQVA